MNFLDVRTVMFSHLATTGICTLVIIFLWLQNRDRFSGTLFWVLDYLFQTGGVLLIVLRGAIPDWMSFVLANSLVMAGAFMGYLGLERFVGKKSNPIYNYLLLGVFIAIHIYFTYFEPNIGARNLNLSTGILFFCFQCGWLVFHRVHSDMRRITRGVGLVFGLFCLMSLIRIIIILAAPPPDNDFFKSGFFDTLILMSYQLLLILLAYNLTLMSNQRLLRDIRYQEEKFTKAFHSSSYALTLTRLSDGRIMEVNDGFLNITGFQRPEVIGKTTTELHLWVREEDRLNLVKAANEGDKIQGKEFLFRSKSGDLLTGLLSADIVLINQEPFLLASINDITGRKKAEEALRESKERYRQLVKNANEAILVAQDGMIKFHNPKAVELSGYSEEDLPDRPFVEFIYPEDRGLVLERHQERLKGAIVPPVYSFRIVDKEGKIKWVEINSVVMSWKGRPATLIFISEITERKEMEDQLQKMSIMDDLTGLYNRRGFLTLAQQQLKVAERTKKEMILFFTDVDNMKWINDNLGHQQGDQALMDISVILKETFRDSDIISRIGGDEFAILALDTVEINPDILISRLKHSMKSFNQKGQRPFKLSLSMGMSRYHPAHPSSIDQLLAESDRAMYEEKRNKNI